MYHQDTEKILANAKYKVGDRVYHENRKQWVSITAVGISEKRWMDYGILELNYDCVSDKNEPCWAYEADLS